jgi:hypothetical protein
LQPQVPAVAPAQKGLTEPVFDKLKADLAKALLSLPAVTAFEYGAGFAVATARGSANNDAFVRKDGGRIGTATNRHGGMLGGISSGEPILLRVAVKPTSSLPRPQPTVTRAGEPTEIATRGRHDPCLLPRFVPMGEAMVALVLADHWLRWRAQCGPRGGNRPPPTHGAVTSCSGGPAESWAIPAFLHPAAPSFLPHPSSQSQVSRLGKFIESSRRECPVFCRDFDRS